MNATQQAVIFDWNCTILDDIEPIVFALNKVLEHFDIAPVSLKKYQEEYVVPINKTYLSLGLSEEQVCDYQDEIVDIWTKNYVEACAKLHLRDGAKQMLTTFHDVGYKLAVLSNYTVDAIKKQADLFSISHFFDAILANQKLGTAMKSGGKSGYLQKFLQEHNIKQALIVGDTAEEVEIAHELGFLGVVITGGAATEKRLRAANPDFLISSLAELPSIAQKVFAKQEES